MNEVANIESMDIAQLAAMAGADPAAQRITGLPELKVNMDDEDGQGNEIPRGSFYVKGAETAVYSKEVRFRVLAQNFQYTEYDPSENKMACKSIVANNMRAEFIDTRGSVRCGSPTSKEKKLLPESEQKRYANIACVRQLRGIVNYSGTTATGEKMDVVDQPCIIRLKGSNFMPFQSEVFDGIPAGKMIWDFESTLSLERLKNGSVVYFVTHFKPDFSQQMGLQGEALDTLKFYLTKIAEENKAVREAYESAIRDRSMSERLSGDTDYPYDTLENDFE